VGRLGRREEGDFPQSFLWPLREFKWDLGARKGFEDLFRPFVGSADLRWPVGTASGIRSPLKGLIRPARALRGSARAGSRNPARACPRLIAQPIDPARACSHLPCLGTCPFTARGKGSEISKNIGPPQSLRAGDSARPAGDCFSPGKDGKTAHTPPIGGRRTPPKSSRPLSQPPIDLQHPSKTSLTASR
jgi:hypothetical protein